MNRSDYLIEGRTKTGKVRYYVSKTLREGALPAMPEGFEFSENINGVVSVRKIDSSAASVPEADVALARMEMARHPHLQGYRIEVVKGEIVVFEPRGGILSDWIMDVVRDDGMMRRVQYDPVMKFVPLRGRSGYWVHRMTYRGDGGWSWPLGMGFLRELLKRFLGCVGTDEFFELL
ncbi:MAG: hypothetical protein SCM96_05240 [Acidobacteriota bacterium]|nr:hypothetical protein [Acidobacteriota bacterium]